MLVVAVVLTLVGFGVWCWITIRTHEGATGSRSPRRCSASRSCAADGSPASLGRLIWLRNVVNGLISIIPLYGLVDMLFIFGESRQCLHDKIADTIVVKA